ncbi:hypothetical protein MD484_g8940, partial [Candolleomyces efflorescens]
MAIACLVVGLQNPDTVQRSSNGTYCNFVLRLPSRVSSVAVATLMIPTIALEVITTLMLRKNWAMLRHRQLPIGTVLRVLVFTLIGILCIGLGIVFATMGEERNPDFNIILATVPVAAVIVFGTQRMEQSLELEADSDREFKD